MDKVREIHLVALHLYQDAREAELPGYAELMRHAADELEKQAFELERSLDRERAKAPAVPGTMRSSRKRRVHANAAHV
jgi:hypothetical protein